MKSTPMADLVDIFRGSQKVVRIAPQPAQYDRKERNASTFGHPRETYRW